MVKYPNLVDGNALSEEHLFKFIAADVEGTSTETAETELATVQVPANSISKGILIMAEIQGFNAGGVDDLVNGDFTVRVGTNSSVLSNGAVRTHTLNVGEGRDSATAAAVYILPCRQSGMIIFFDTTLTKTSLNYVSVSGEAKGTDDTVVCKQLIVLGF